MMNKDVEAIKNLLMKSFKMTKLDEQHMFLGLSIQHDT